MGTMCQTRIVQTEAETFFTQFDQYGTDTQVKETVKIEPRLKNVIGSANCQIHLTIFTNPQKTQSKSGGSTDTGVYDSSTNIITFQKFFIMEYFFEKDQPIEFRVTGTINGVVRTSLPSIMGSRAQTMNKQIEGTDGVILELKGVSYKKKLTSTLNINVNLTGSLYGKGLRYTLKSKGNMQNPKNQLLYSSELITPLKNVRTVNFHLLSMQDIYIAPDGNYDSNYLNLEIFDAKHNRKLGEYNGALKPLIGMNTTLALSSSTVAKISFDAIKNYSFIDYLRGGMQINLWVAIDFTGSNGEPSAPNSLHYLGAKQNQYETAIRACGDIVAYYDYDQKFPAFGFGGKFNGSQEVNHCYPLNGNMDDPEIDGIDGILKAYRETLNNTQLWGPTHFHHFIDKLNNTVKQDIARENYNTYNILMILTDGIIEDMDDTINALVESSYLPVSVIIIGIGNADFSNMDVLDADDDPLYDNNGRKADRDLVQFVPYKDFQNNGQKLAEQVLEEVPRQIVEYYQHKKIAPGEPIVQIQTQKNNI
jgi:hypothetical protein